MKLVTALEYWASAKARVAKGKYNKLLHSPQALVDSMVHKAVGSSVIGKVQITKGETNEVYSAQLKNGSEVIVRISRRDKSRFRTERWAIDQCAKAGVPVPRVIAVETVEYNEGPISISIETKIQGTPLDEIAKGNISGKELERLLRLTGDVLSKIHSVETNGFGELDENGNGAHYSIGEMLSDKHFNKSQFIGIARSIDLNSEIVERSLDVLYEYSAKYPRVSPHLIHNDLAPCHVFVNGDQISGIIDFEIAEGGDPMREFARWQFYFEDGYPLQYLIEGYGISSVFTGDCNERLHMWKLYTGLVTLDWYFRLKNRQKIELCKDRLTKDLRYFE